MDFQNVLSTGYFRNLNVCARFQACQMAFILAYAFVTYILWGTLYSTVNIPYGSMASVITADPVERTTLSTLRTMGAMLAGLIINVGGPLLNLCR